MLTISVGPDDQPNTWLARHKSGLGRAVKNQWTVTAEIGPEFFESMEKERKWHFGFNDYYDVYVWDLEPGKHSCHLFNNIQEVCWCMTMMSISLTLISDDDQGQTLSRNAQLVRANGAYPENLDS